MRPILKARLLRLLCLTSVLSSTALALAQQKKLLDGIWWPSISKSEQVGFVSGYIDCTDTELHGPAFVGAYVGFRQRVSDYYQQKPEARNKAVGDVLVSFVASEKKTANSQPSQKPDTPQGTPEVFPLSGYFNGDYWDQSDDEEQLGFLEGYIWCFEHRPTTRSAKFSKSPQTYRDGINDWYSDQGSRNRGQTPISTVLFRLRDHASSHAKANH